ncbi:MAG: histidine phosphatase family protein [Gaiellaceae bacterium]
MTTIYLARHGESDWNVENRFQGLTDRPLTDRGVEQAGELADFLADEPLDAVYASPLLRALATAEIVAARKGMEVTPLAALREVDVGSWAGLSRAEVELRFPEGFRSWLSGGRGWTDGESYEEMAERVLAALREIAATYPAGRVLAVSHGGPIRAAHAEAAGMDVYSYRRLHPVEPNARLSAVAVENGTIRRID